MKQLEFPDNIQRLVSKLPMYMLDRWPNIVHNCTERFEEVRFTDLVSFLRKGSQKVNHPVLSVS